MPEFLSRLPAATVYSSLPPIESHSPWISASNALYEAGPLRSVRALVRYQRRFQKELGERRTRVLFCPFHNEGLMSPGGVRQVLIVHDVVPLQFPREYPASHLLWRTLYRAAIRNSAHVICVSQATRRELIARLDLPEDRVSVVYNGYTPPRNVPEVARQPRFLYVASGHGPHKNIPALLEGFARFPLHKEYQLRIVGVPHPRHTPSLHALAGRLQIDRQVRFLAHLDEAAMQHEYLTAAGFIYPSLVEGFGLPLLEAMAHRVPVAASRSSVIPEIAGSAALYFDPSDPAAITDALVRLATDETLRNQLVPAGLANLARFSWAMSAEQCVQICRFQNS